MHHHTVHRSCVSHTCYETTRHVKDLAPGFLGFRVSGGALTREILVSALPVSGARKPFPGAERGDRFDSVGDRFANAMTDHANAAIITGGTALRVGAIGLTPSTRWCARSRPLPADH